MPLSRISGTPAPTDTNFREAQRNAIFADAFQRDPEFFEFYRSMIAYAAALDPTGTTMVLSPDSEFFRFFRSPTPTPGGAPGTAAPAAGAPEATTPAPNGTTTGATQPDAGQ